MIVIYALVTGYAFLWVACFAVFIGAWIAARIMRPQLSNG